MSTNIPETPGCILEPSATAMLSIESLLGATDLPEQYIVPSWRSCFDGNFQWIPSMIRPRIMDQGALDSCVGHATAVQKSAQEGVIVSPRDIFRLAKLLDGYGIESFGTTLWAAQDALMQMGVAEDALVPRDPGMGRSAYLVTADVTPDVISSRLKHKSRSAYFVPRTLIRPTLISYGYPLVVSSPWYPQDNAIGSDGLMRPPLTSNWLGHAYACIGWIVVSGKTSLVMVNSFGPDWGADGIFFVPLDGTENRLSNAYVAVDIEPNLGQLLAQYNGRNVRCGADHWKIEAGTRRKYPNEDVWWLNGNLFGYDVYEIDATSLETIPLGPDMDIDSVPFKEKERYRQMRQHLGKP
jgi:hypothetical protein